MLNLGPTEEGDPIISCVFKTEMTTHLLRLTQASITVQIGPVYVTAYLIELSCNLIWLYSIDYTKKKEKRAQVKFIKDETVPRNDTYKSHTVHVPSGEPPGSLSKPPAKRKEGVVRPITQGKLLRKGGPSDVRIYRLYQTSWLELTHVQKPAASRSTPTARALPGKSTTAAKPPAAVAKPAASTAGRSVPPPPPRAAAPPPPPPAEPDVEQYKAKYAFQGQEGEMSLQKDDIVELVEKDADGNGWWLVRKDGAEGWAPNNYLELVPPKPKAAAPPPPPPPPASRRPVPTPAAAAASAPKPSAVTANPSAKPVAVFPGMAAANGSAAPWKKNVSTASHDSSNDSTPAASRAGSSFKPAPPPVAGKPKPPPVAAKPGVPPKVGAKPPVPTAARPSAAAAKPKVGAAKPPAAPGGQLDLAAVVSVSPRPRAVGSEAQSFSTVRKAGSKDDGGRLNAFTFDIVLFRKHGPSSIYMCICYSRHSGLYCQETPQNHGRR